MCVCALVSVQKQKGREGGEPQCVSVGCVRTQGACAAWGWRGGGHEWAEKGVNAAERARRLPGVRVAGAPGLACVCAGQRVAGRRG